MGLVQLAVCDAAISFLWSLYVACMRPVTAAIASSLELRGYEFHIVLVLLSLNIFLFSWLGATLGGALWNPSPVLAFYSVGKSKDSLFSMAVRLPSQVLGAVGGVLAARELVPSAYRPMLRGPQLKVDLYTGILAEAVLTFAIIFAVLTAVLRGPKSMFLKNWIIILSTIAVITLGSEYTGPSLNPANAFGWAYLNNNHNSLEHLLVYWLAPLGGSLIASWAFQLLLGVRKSKEKTA